MRCFLAAATIFLAAALSPAVLGQSANTRLLATGTLTLDQIVALALANNPEITAATYDGEAASARLQAARAARMPRIGLEGGYTRYGDDLRLSSAQFNGEPGVFGDNILVTELVLRLPLYSGGRLTADLRAAELLEASAGQRLARNQGELVYNVSSLYFSQLAQMRLIESLEFSASTLEGQLKRVNALITGRKAAKIDALRTEVKLADVRQRLLREHNTLAVQRQALLNLMGAKGADASFALAGNLRPPTVVPGGFESLTVTALAQRPDARAARIELEAQAARVEAARANGRPSVDLLVATGQRLMENPTQHPPGLNNNDDTSRIGITFVMPLFDGRRSSSRVDEENARLAAQRERLDQLQARIRLEIETAFFNLTSARERLASTDTAIALAAEGLHIEEEKYELSQGTAQEVLDAQSALLEAQTNHIRALADANIAAAQLALATGENLP